MSDRHFIFRRFGVPIFYDKSMTDEQRDTTTPRGMKKDAVLAKVSPHTLGRSGDIHRSSGRSSRN